MKKISYLFISLILLINIVACAGYKPIFSSTNLKFKIVDHSISGNKKLGNQIYSKLYNLSELNSSNPEAKKISVLINISKIINASTKDSAGKILSYKINLSTTVEIKDFDSNNIILNENFVYTSNYQVQNQYSETLKLEDRSTENLINKTYQELLIKLSENILSK